MSDPYTDVLVERDGATLVITLNRPAKRNAMTADMSRRIADAFDELDESDKLSTAVLTGAGGVFCAGMDLQRFVQGESPSVPGRGFGGMTERPPKKPVIAAVEGYALAGGFELVLACDVVVASSSARFGLPEVKRGLVARAGGLLRLPERVPLAHAMEMVLTGAPIAADRAYELGLVNRVVDEGAAVDTALGLASEIATNAPLAIAAAKQVILASPDWSIEERFDRQAELVDPVMRSDDATEGARAFVEKRSPVWTSR